MSLRYLIHRLRQLTGFHGPSAAMGKCPYCRQRWGDFGRDFRAAVEEMGEKVKKALDE